MDNRIGALMTGLAGVAGLAVGWMGTQMMWPSPMAGKHNIVMMVVCTLRKDQTTPYGAPEMITPFMQSWSERGATFDSAYAAAPWTRAASTALWTGRHAIRVGLTQPNDGVNSSRLSRNVITLAEHLQGVGYQTVGGTANPNTNKSFGFGQGFDQYVRATTRWAKGGQKSPAIAVFEPVLDVVETLDADRPAFLMTMILDPHEPRNNSRVDRARVHDPAVPPRVNDYRAAVRSTDMRISDYIGRLNDVGFTEENTWFVLVNDHGEGLNYPAASQGRGHGNFTFGSTVEMPWLVMGPGIAPGTHISGVASQVDVVPTLMGLAGVEGFEGDGYDWSPRLRGETGAEEPTYAFVDTWFHESSRAAVYGAETHCHIDFRDPRPEGAGMLPAEACYDVSTDRYGLTPLEQNDEPMLALLRAWRTESEAQWESWEDKAHVRITQEIQDQLALLGYVDEEGEAVEADKAAENAGRGGGRREGRRKGVKKY